MASSPRTLPKPTPETAHFWEGTSAGELRLQRCLACRLNYFPPQPFCPACSSEDIKVVVASGKGRLYSYVISHVPTPGFASPHIIAVVVLDEGPQLLTNLVGIDADATKIELDALVTVSFEAFDEISLPLFRLTSEPSGV